MRHFSSLLIFICLGLLSFINSSKAELIHVQTIPGKDGFNQEYWVVTCSKDDFSDRKRCLVNVRTKSPSIKQYNLFFTILSDGEIIADLSSDGEAYPGSKKLIRVDSNDTFEIDSEIFFLLVGNENVPPIHAELLYQLKSGNEVKTRMFEWPYENRAIDESISLIGFNEAISTATNYLTGTLKFSVGSAIRMINHQAMLMAVDYSKLRACGQKTLAEKLYNEAKEMTRPFPEIFKNFSNSFEKINSTDPYGPLKGKIGCEDSEDSMKQTISKIGEVITNLED